MRYLRRGACRQDSNQPIEMTYWKRKVEIPSPRRKAPNEAQKSPPEIQGKARGLLCRKPVGVDSSECEKKIQSKAGRPFGWYQKFGSRRGNFPIDRGCHVRWVMMINHIWKRVFLSITDDEGPLERFFGVEFIAMLHAFEDCLVKIPWLA